MEIKDYKMLEMMYVALKDINNTLYEINNTLKAIKGAGKDANLTEIAVKIDKVRESVENIELD